MPDPLPGSVPVELTVTIRYELDTHALEAGEYAELGIETVDQLLGEEIAEMKRDTAFLADLIESDRSHVTMAAEIVGIDGLELEAAYRASDPYEFEDDTELLKTLGEVEADGFISLYPAPTVTQTPAFDVDSDEPADWEYEDYLDALVHLTGEDVDSDRAFHDAMPGDLPALGEL